MKIRIGEIRIHISAFIFIIPPVLLIAGCLKEYAAAFFSILLHELGHIIIARIFCCRPGLIRLMPVGLSVSLNDAGCPRAVSILIYCAGPVVNLLILLGAVIAGDLFPGAGSFTKIVAATNAYLALFNLIPAYPLDGGRIFMELLAGRMGLLAAGRLVRRLTLFLALLVLFFGALQLYESVNNFSLIIIGVYIIVLWKNCKMEGALMNIRELVYRRSRFMKKGIYPARDLVVIKTTRLDETLKYMDFDRFHLVYVLDDDLRVLRVFTEKEIMDACSDGNGLTFGQLLDKDKASDNLFRDDPASS